MKPNYLILGWMALFLAVLAGVVVYQRGEKGFAKAEFGGVPIVVEYARTPEARERGLSGREEIPERYGMLFAFEAEAKHSFWMKGMLVPIDIFWLDSGMRVISVAERVDPNTYPQSFAPSAPARYVLETRAGFATEHSVGEGAVLVVQ